MYFVFLLFHIFTFPYLLFTNKSTDDLVLLPYFLFLLSVLTPMQTSFNFLTPYHTILEH
jgi:hypothetical protein